MTYTYQYPRAALTADIVVYGFDGFQLHILLIERGVAPYKGYWALPGGFMNMDETIEQCAARELSEETGLTGAYLRQFGVFSSVDRDPRERVVTVAFLGLVSKSMYRLTAGDDAAKAEWFAIDKLPKLAFDHDAIVERARTCLRDLIAIRPAVLQLLDRRFSIAELQRLVEIITGETYDRRNFQRRLIQSELLRNEGTASEPGAARPAMLYSVLPPDCSESEDPFKSTADCDDLDDETCDYICESMPELKSKPARLSKALRKGIDFFKF